MIDSLIVAPLGKYTQEDSNPFVKYLVSMGRDNLIVIWKLFDGRVMHPDGNKAREIEKESGKMEYIIRRF